MKISYYTRRQVTDDEIKRYNLWPVTLGYIRRTLGYDIDGLENELDGTEIYVPVSEHHKLLFQHGNEIPYESNLGVIRNIENESGKNPIGSSERKHPRGRL